VLPWRPSSRISAPPTSVTPARKDYEIPFCQWRKRGTLSRTWRPIYGVLRVILDISDSVSYNGGNAAGKARTSRWRLPVLVSMIAIYIYIYIHIYIYIYQRKTWEGLRRRFRWHAFPRPYSSANWIDFWAGGTITTRIHFRCYDGKRLIWFAYVLDPQCAMVNGRSFLFYIYIYICMYIYIYYVMRVRAHTHTHTHTHTHNLCTWI